MYKQYLKTIQTKMGQAITTSVDISANSPIFEFKGDFFTRSNLKHDLSKVLQIGPNEYIGLSGDVDDYINHSCDPNCYVSIVGNRAILYSLYKIPAGAELNFDYSSTSTDDFTMTCLCGSYKCRKLIGNFSSLDEETKESYKSRGIVPQYVK